MRQQFCVCGITIRCVCVRSMCVMCYVCVRESERKRGNLQVMLGLHVYVCVCLCVRVCACARSVELGGQVQLIDVFDPDGNEPFF